MAAITLQYLFTREIEKPPQGGFSYCQLIQVFALFCENEGREAPEYGRFDVIEPRLTSDGSFARPETERETPIVRVRFFLEGVEFEDVAVLNGDYNLAVLRATKRALGFPEDDEWKLICALDGTPGEIDLFACSASKIIYNGAEAVLLDPEGKEVFGEFKAEKLWADKSVFKARAFAKALCTYYQSRGIEPKSSIPKAKQVSG